MSRFFDGGQRWGCCWAISALRGARGGKRKPAPAGANSLPHWRPRLSNRRRPPQLDRPDNERQAEGAERWREEIAFCRG